MVLRPCAYHHKFRLYTGFAAGRRLWRPLQAVRDTPYFFTARHCCSLHLSVFICLFLLFLHPIPAMRRRGYPRQHCQSESKDAAAPSESEAMNDERTTMNDFKKQPLRPPSAASSPIRGAFRESLAANS